VYALITDTVTGLLDDVIWARLYQACAGHGKGEKITMAGTRSDVIRIKSRFRSRE